MAIVDIQIDPPVLTLDPETRRGRFRVQIGNQLGRDGGFRVSVVPVEPARAEWFALEDRHRLLALKKDETAVFDLNVTVPEQIPVETYGFQLRCAEVLDENVRVDSERRDVKVVPSTSKKVVPAAWKKWALIGGAAVVLIGGGIGLALWLTGRNTPPPPPVPAADASPAAADGCAEDFGRPCGQCQGTILCGGGCSKPTPANLGALVNFFNQVVPIANNQTRQLGGACGAGFVFDSARATVARLGQPGPGGIPTRGRCDVVAPGSAKNCRVMVRAMGALGAGSIPCQVIINQKRVCD